MRLPNGILIKFNEITNIPIPHLSGYLSGTRAMSKVRSLTLEKAGQQLGYKFTAADWMYKPTKIKRILGQANGKKLKERKR